MDEYGLRRACAWIGNSVKVAMENYALMRKGYFLDVGNSADLKCDAKIADLGAMGRLEQRNLRTSVKRVSTAQRGSARMNSVAEAGLEPARPNGHRILNPERLPIPPLGQNMLSC